MQQVNSDVVLLNRRNEDSSWREICFRKGWSEKHTDSFLRETFDVFKISGGRDQDFIIPPLGKKALHVNGLILDSSAVVTGIEQFENINYISIVCIPKNGFCDFYHFKFLKNIDIEVKITKKIISAICEAKSLDSMFFRYFLFESISHFRAFIMLKSIGFCQGSLRDIKDISCMVNLESVSLSYLKNISDLSPIENLSKLKKLCLENIPKGIFVFKFGKYRDIENIRIVAVPGCVIDFNDVYLCGNITSIMAHCDHVNASIDSIFSCKKLKMLCMMAEGFSEEVTESYLINAAKIHERKIKAINFGSNKGKRVFSVDFIDE